MNIVSVDSFILGFLIGFCTSVITVLIIQALDHRRERRENDSKH